jgi:hypothetical protein
MVTITGENKVETYGHSLESHQWAKTVIERDLYCCNELADLYQKSNEYWFEDLSNMYAPIDYNKQDFLTWLIEDQNLEGQVLDDSLFLYEANCEDSSDCGAYIMQEFVEYLVEENQDYPQEIFQWYLVDQWLAEKLIELGQPVLETESNYLWGRTCCGQAIILDGTFQRLYNKLNENTSDIEAV